MSESNFCVIYDGEHVDGWVYPDGYTFVDWSHRRYLRYWNHNWVKF